MIIKWCEHQECGGSAVSISNSSGEEDEAGVKPAVTLLCCLCVDTQSTFTVWSHLVALSAVSSSLTCFLVGFWSWKKKNLIWGENSCFAHRIRFISSRNSRESSRMDSLLQVLSGLCIKVTCSARSHIHCLKLSFLVSCWPLSVVVSDQWILYWFLFTSMKKLKL